jgi:hypothetical protein
MVVGCEAIRVGPSAGSGLAQVGSWRARDAQQHLDL